MKSGSNFAKSKLAAATLVVAGTLAIGHGTSVAQDAAAQTAPSPPAGSVSGLGDVNLFPKRVVIDGRRAIATVGLYNKAVDPGDYEIKIVDMAMTPQGQLISFDNGLDEATKAKVRTASQMLRYSPRRVRLGSTESQLIRVMARGSSDLPDGEYRSHFMVTSVPDAEGFSIEEATGAQQADGIGVTIRPRFGIAIPVIVRVGETTLDVGITGATLLTARDGTQAVGFILNRSGTRSAFGDVVIKSAGSAEPIAVSRGVGIYPEIDAREVIVPIDPETDPSLLTSGARLQIEFVDDDFAPGSKLAEHSFVVP
ncbi:hypothetical protein [Qipengyuania nanhaisediminis]|uniref:P pilus assembly protein, chaperone PapD n=1 Tax=Qipengyuania nanhaisediminis TaxID=604088 RepID=A0A1I5NHR1_9SPHN|nr:hypothetical protein [Qipengyuania nanhaisediminis]SFP20886.1 hypothetical protein SAMN04488060_1837 [Qipengyuania nanhaisediminis]